MTEDDRARKPEPSGRAHPRPHLSGADAPAHAETGASGGDWLLVGEVVGVFGIRGELKVRPETDFPERFERTPTLYAGPTHIPMAVESARLARNQVVLKLAGVDDANAAEALRGTRLYVPGSQAVTLAPGQFFLHDVIGLAAERPDGTLLGTIVDVYTGTAQDLFVVRERDTGREVLVPAVGEMIKRVDVAGGKVVMEPIPGLFDDRFERAE